MTRFLARPRTANASGLVHGRLDGATEVPRSGRCRTSAFSLKQPLRFYLSTTPRGRLQTVNPP